MWVKPGPGERLMRWIPPRYPEVAAGMSIRRHGVSSPPWESLNISFGVGDDPAAVRTNRERILGELGSDLASLATAEQVHRGRVARVERGGWGADSNRDWILGTDGLVTDRMGVVLGLGFADCVPVFLAAPGWVGVLHAGWRGCASDVIAHGVAELVARGVEREAIDAGVGPAIGPCCYEVDRPVYDALAKSEAVARAFVPGFRPEHWQLDMWRLAAALLKDAGVAPGRVEIAGVCTACHPQDFFSYRRDAGKTGRMGGFICRPSKSA